MGIRPLRRATRLWLSFLVLGAICACGGTATEEALPVADPAAGPGASAVGQDPPDPSEPITLPDAVMPLTEGGELQEMGEGASTVMAQFPDQEFETLHTRVTEWMPQHGWTLVEGSEVDSERSAALLEELGQHEAAELARSQESYGASYQQDGNTVAVNIDSLSGTLQLTINWF